MTRPRPGTFATAVAVTIAGAALPGALTAPAGAATANDDGLYSQHEVHQSNVEKGRPLRKFVQIKEAWAGHDGETTYGKVAMRDIPTPKQIRKQSPDAIYQITLGTSKHEPETGDDELGFVIADIYVTADGTRVEKVTEDYNPDCSIDFSFSRKSNEIITAAPHVCGYYTDAADGDPVSFDVSAQVYYDPWDETRNVADGMRLHRNVT